MFPFSSSNTPNSSSRPTIATTDLKIWYNKMGSPRKIHDKDHDINRCANRDSGYMYLAFTTSFCRGWDSNTTQSSAISTIFQPYSAGSILMVIMLKCIQFLKSWYEVSKLGAVFIEATSRWKLIFNFVWNRNADALVKAFTLFSFAIQKIWRINIRRHFSKYSNIPPPQPQSPRVSNFFLGGWVVFFKKSTT